MLFKNLTLLCIPLAIIACSACSSVKYKYKYDEDFKRDGYPKMVFIDDQIYKLNTKGMLEADRQPFTEIITKNGKQYSGKLSVISHEEITLVLGSKVDYKDKIPMHDLIKIDIPKEEILILKLW